MELSSMQEEGGAYSRPPVSSNMTTTKLTCQISRAKRSMPRVTLHTQSHRHAGNATQHRSGANNGVDAGGDASAGLSARREKSCVAYFTLQHLHGEPNHTANKRAN
jgi:hypothetical protein